MAVQLINIGNVANDGTGDDLREAFIKVNQNFEELDLRDDEKTTGSNLGATGEGIFANRVNYDLQFKKIVGGENITLTATDNTITIDSESTLTVVADTGEVDLLGTTTLNIEGGDGISTSITNSTLTIENTGIANLIDDTTPQLGGNLNAGGFNITNAGNIDTAQVTGAFIGNLTGLVHGYDMRDWATWNEGWDFGSVSEDYTSAIQFIVANTDVDFGTFSSPAVGNVDLGTI